MYVDRVRVTDLTFTTGGDDLFKGTSKCSRSSWYIGDQYNSFRGSIKLFSVYNKPLTDSEIAINNAHSPIMMLNFAGNLSNAFVLKKNDI